MDKQWKIELFGELKVRSLIDPAREFGAAELRTRKTSSLLAYLALHPQPHSRTALGELLWPEHPIDQRRASLRTALSSIRRQIQEPGADVLSTGRETVVLDSHQVTTDVAEFQAALLLAAQAATAEERSRRFIAALRLSPTPLLPQNDEAWIAAERARLEELYLAAAHSLITHHLQSGALDSAAAWAARVVERNPGHQETHCDLISVQLARQQSGAAVQAYTELQSLVERQGGPHSARVADIIRQMEELQAVASGVGDTKRVTPPVSVSGAVALQSAQQDCVDSDATLESATAISPAAITLPAGKSRRQDEAGLAPPTDLPVRVPAAPRRSVAPPGLPLLLTRFFGREAECLQLREILLREGARLVTLVGPGGCGKTRLSLELAHQVSEQWGDRIYFVPLADSTAPQFIAETILDAMHLTGTAHIKPLTQIVRALNERPSLLILDNLEHLLEGATAIVAKLLRRVPSLTCLATSRHPLQLPEERVFRLAPLSVPERADATTYNRAELLSYDSVRLFVDRAQAARSDFQLTETNAPSIAALCQRLEGVPLAIELAASRATVLSPAQLLAQLEHRLQFLKSRSQGVTERQRTLYGALEWSRRLLPDDLQHFFTQLSVFRGSWAAQAATPVCDEPRALPFLGELQEWSLIAEEEVPDELRFRMLDTVRDYADELLAVEEREPLRGRHADYYLDLAERVEASVMSQERETSLRYLDRDQDNFRVALGWALERDPWVGLRLAGALWRFWEARSRFTEGRHWLENALAQTSAPPSDEPINLAWRAKSLNGAGRLAWYRAEFITARQCLEESLSLARRLKDEKLTANALHSLGLVAAAQGDAAARSYLEEGVALARARGEASAIKDLLLGLGLVLIDVGDLAAATTVLEEGLHLARQLQDKRCIAFALNNLGFVAYFAGEYPRAHQLHAVSLGMMRELSERWSVARALWALGNVACVEHDYDEAQTLYNESLLIHKELGSKWEVPCKLEALAYRANMMQRHVPERAPDLSRAARLLGAASALREQVGHPLPAVWQSRHEEHLSSIRGQLSERAFRTEWERGRLMSREAAIDYALEA
jgi:predicted ATPase/DNA-binding SARP family transcriptional activator